MTRTKHFQKRFDQRGFSETMLELVMQFGRTEKARGGAVKIFFGKKEGSALVQECKRIIQLIDKAKGATLIIKDDQIITGYKNS